MPGMDPQRKAEPGDDLASRFMEVMVGERPINHPEIVSMMTVLLIGGLDSVSHTMGAIIRFLAENPDKRRYLAEDTGRIAPVLDELLRRHSITSTARVVRQDMVYEGVEMKAGDRIFLCAWLHALRSGGMGCAGGWTCSARHHDVRQGHSPLRGCDLARLEIRTLLEEWLTRIPDCTDHAGR